MTLRRITKAVLILAASAAALGIAQSIDRPTVGEKKSPDSPFQVKPELRSTGKSRVLPEGEGPTLTFKEEVGPDGKIVHRILTADPTKTDYRPGDVVHGPISEKKKKKSRPATDSDK